jgi:hypothetical protein
VGSPRVVEVIARFGDAVVAARRVGDPVGSSRPLSLGVVLVGLGLGLATLEIATRGTLVMLPVDGVAFGVGLALFGLVLASVGLHRRAEPDAHAFWIGQCSGVDLTTLVPGLAADTRLPLVRLTDAGIELRFVPGMKGTLVRDGEDVTLEALASEGPARADIDGSFGVPLRDAERAVLQLGDVQVTVEPADGIPKAPRARFFDGKLVVATLFAGVIITGVIVLAHHFVPASRILPDEEDRPEVQPERAKHPGTFTYPPRDAR